VDFIGCNVVVSAEDDLGYCKLIVLPKWLCGRTSVLAVNCCSGDSGEMRALYDYTGPDESYLSLTAGEIITNVSLIDDDWGKGQNSDEKTGLFPLSYCQVILAILSLDLSASAPLYLWSSHSQCLRMTLTTHSVRMQLYK